MSPTKRALLSVLLVTACIAGPGAIAYALWSAPATGTLQVTIASPTAVASPTIPSNFRCLANPSATPALQGNDRYVYWDSVSGATSYVLYRVTGSTTAKPTATPSPVATVSPVVASPSAAVPVANNTYSWYSVTAVNSGGSSGRSTELRLRRDGGTHECVPQ